MLNIKSIIMLALLWSVGALPRTDPPHCSNSHFNFMWNAPTERCATLDRELDLSYFCVVTTTLKTAYNQTISMFYTDRFGIFPSIDEKTHTQHNGGIPQRINMTAHLEAAAKDILLYMPDDNPGLGVLDMEEWRPLWSRNWGSKDIYRQVSHEYGLNHKVSGQDSFETAAKNYFLESMRLGQRMRPKRLWGYYLFPDCYNHEYLRDMGSYTGKCPKLEEERNNELMWLWKESDALFPSIYLGHHLTDTMQSRLYVRHRIRESIRVSTLPDSSYSIPIYAFIRPVYKDFTDSYMSEFDLVNTIGEAAALGAAGVVSWGDMHVASTKDTCNDARWHLAQVMNPYMMNITKATQLCSQALCQGQGRCVRKQWDSDVFLHLDPTRYQIQQQFPHGPVTVTGSLSQEDVRFFDTHFDCMCYSQEPCRSVLKIDPNIHSDQPYRTGFGITLSLFIVTFILLCVMILLRWNVCLLAAKGQCQNGLTGQL